MSNILVTVWFGLLRIILTFLHLLYSGFQYFDLAWALFKRKLEESMHLQAPDTELYMSRFVTNLEKCPSHLAVIMGSETIRVTDFSNIVMWCLAAGISFVSFYDHTGYLKEHERLYYKYLVSKRRLDPKHIAFTAPLKNGLKKNGILPKIHVNILSIEDGKPLCVNLVKKLIDQVASGDLSYSKLDIATVDKEFQQITMFPDPELAILCSDVCSTYGFLPWQIRTTEFIQVRTLKDIQLKDFMAIIDKYSQCNQRFGK